jgi:hypothetical protein
MITDVEPGPVPLLPVSKLRPNGYPWHILDERPEGPVTVSDHPDAFAIVLFIVRAAYMAALLAL